MKKEPKQDDYPYKTLGLRLKTLRQRASKTLSEVAGAMEIDEKALAKIELGQIKPEENLLENLSDFFNLSDAEAIKLLDLAGYTQDIPTNFQEPLITKTIIMMLSHQDSKVVYTDGLDIHYDSSGLIMNFKQTVGQKKPVSVAKLGMSYIQAREIHRTLTKVLLRAKYLKSAKSLPKSPPSKSKE